MAIMEVANWDTRCSECGRSTDWSEEGHVVNRGYDMEINGTPGCGAKWTGIAFVGSVIWYDGKFQDPRKDNPYYPDWMKALPLVGQHG